MAYDESWNVDLNLQMEIGNWDSGIMITTFNYLRDYTNRTEKRKVGESQVYIIDKNHFEISYSDRCLFGDIGPAFDSITNWRFDNYGDEDLSPETVEIEDGNSIAYIHSYNVLNGNDEPAYLDYEYLNYFAYTLGWLKRLHIKYVIIKPYPANIPKKQYKGKKQEIRTKIIELMNFYKEFGFKKTIGMNDPSEPYMCCDLDEIDPVGIRRKLKYEYIT